MLYVFVKGVYGFLTNAKLQASSSSIGCIKKMAEAVRISEVKLLGTNNSPRGVHRHCSVSCASGTHQVFEHWLDNPRNPDYILGSSCVRIVCVKGNSLFCRNMHQTAVELLQK